MYIMEIINLITGNNQVETENKVKIIEDKIKAIDDKLSIALAVKENVNQFTVANGKCTR